MERRERLTLDLAQQVTVHHTQDYSSPVVHLEENSSADGQVLESHLGLALGLLGERPDLRRVRAQQACLEFR